MAGRGSRFTERMEGYDPRYAEHEWWQCIDSQGADQGHPIWNQSVLRGAFPECPVCGGKTCMPVEEPAEVLG